MFYPEYFTDTVFEPVFLDDMLQLGWFRMRDHLFSTDFIPYHDSIHPVFWGRIELEMYAPSSSLKQATKKLQSFTISCSYFDAISDEVEALYTCYSHQITFETPRSVHDILGMNHRFNAFSTLQILVRDHNRLIAVGYVDVGETSHAVILNFYHPDYKKYSLGTGLYGWVILHAQSLLKKYFYPGYISPTLSQFDYKWKQIGASFQWLDRMHNTWHGIELYHRLFSDMSFLHMGK